jgi:hypothetical protein
MAMMRLLVVVSIVAGLVLAGAGPASAFIPGQSTLIITSKGRKIAFRANAKTPRAHPSSSRSDERVLKVLAEEVARDFSGRIIVGEDLMEIDV